MSLLFQRFLVLPPFLSSTDVKLVLPESIEWFTEDQAFPQWFFPPYGRYFNSRLWKDLLGNPVGAGGPELGEHEHVHDDDEDDGEGEWRNEEAHVEPEVAVVVDVEPTRVVT